MIVPEFWAETRLQVRHRGRQFTVRRFGWSDASETDAEQNAQDRAHAALERILAGEPLDRRERKVPYNGSEGVPIREEVVSRHGQAVVTRNSYGALCLNTPDVLFADIDLPDQPPAELACVLFLALLVLAIAAGVWTGAWLLGILLFVLVLFTTRFVVRLIYRLGLRLRGSPESQARQRIDRFLAGHPDWHLRLYRTPAGLRALAMHRTFSPSDSEVTDCFDALGVDPVYARMCRNQQCFRARVSPKPWRIGIQEHLRPRSGAWPTPPELRPVRQRWIEAYESASGAYASCAFLEALGSGIVHPEAQRILNLHDALCQATSSRPIA